MKKSLIFGIVALFFSTTVLSAQAVQGKFELPYATQWGNAVLAAGSYTFLVKPRNFPATVSVWSEGHGRAMIISYGISDTQVTNRNFILISRSDGKARVRALTLGESGVMLSFGVSHRGRQLAYNKPELLQRIPIATSGR